MSMSNVIFPNHQSLLNPQFRSPLTWPVQVGRNAGQEKGPGGFSGNNLSKPMVSNGFADGVICNLRDIFFQG